MVNRRDNIFLSSTREMIHDEKVRCEVPKEQKLITGQANLNIHLGHCKYTPCEELNPTVHDSYY